MANRRFCRIRSCALYGIDGLPVEIEVSILNGLPSFEIVGLVDSNGREARNRVHAAIKNSRFRFPEGRLVASLAPAWMPKEGAAFDLPLALAILAASGQIKLPDADIWVMGELGLDGSVRTVPGLFCRVRGCLDQQPGANLIIPSAGHSEAAAAGLGRAWLLDRLEHCAAVLAAEPVLLTPTDASCRASDIPIGLKEVGKRRLEHRRVACDDPERGGLCGDNPGNELRDDSPYGGPRHIDAIIGQDAAVRALEIAVAGGHHLLMIGSPGCGKSSLAALAPGLMPPLGDQESFEVTRIYSAAGLLGGSSRIWTRPFRSPHHSASTAAMIGGGALPRPGEISLACHGTLFLDEMTEFRVHVLDALRQPMESRQIVLVRSKHCLIYPAGFQLIGAANPCRCGEYLENSTTCRCTPVQVRSHLSRISGPLLDRFDLIVEMHRPKPDVLRSALTRRSSKTDAGQAAAARVARAWIRQAARGASNSRVSDALLDSLYPQQELIDFTADLVTRLGLTMRGYRRLLRVARTIADLRDQERVLPDDIAEAAQYRLTLL